MPKGIYKHKSNQGFQKGHTINKGEKRPYVIGRTAWNKGKKAPGSVNSGSFKKGLIPWNKK